MGKLDYKAITQQSLQPARMKTTSSHIEEPVKEKKDKEETKTDKIKTDETKQENTEDASSRTNNENVSTNEPPKD